MAGTSSRPCAHQNNGTRCNRILMLISYLLCTTSTLSGRRSWDISRQCDNKAHLTDTQPASAVLYLDSITTTHFCFRACLGIDDISRRCYFSFFVGTGIPLRAKGGTIFRSVVLRSDPEDKIIHFCEGSISFFFF